MLALPPLRAKGPIPAISVADGPPVSETSPVAAEGDTFTVKLALVPCVIGKVVVVESVVFAAGRVKAVHAFRRFAPLTEPSPVARS